MDEAVRRCGVCVEMHVLIDVSSALISHANAPSRNSADTLDDPGVLATLI
jgi:hypothetical protein